MKALLAWLFDRHFRCHCGAKVHAQLNDMTDNYNVCGECGRIYWEE